MAKDYFKEGVDVEMLTRYAHLTQEEIKEIEN